MTRSDKSSTALDAGQNLLEKDQAGTKNIPTDMERVALKNLGTLLVQSADGRACMQISLQHNELVIECLAGRLRLSAATEIALSAPSLVLQAEQQLTLKSGGDLQLHAVGQVEVNAASLALRAAKGDVSVYANDDVRLDGERIRMNA